ncbi:conserved hypothetical protein [Burkholderiales bacterium 8X]|nr:conserved hypothetical protein [Burkholderiales bacterium 8X]
MRRNAVTVRETPPIGAERFDRHAGRCFTGALRGVSKGSYDSALHSEQHSPSRPYVFPASRVLPCRNAGAPAAVTAPDLDRQGAGPPGGAGPGRRRLVSHPAQQRPRRPARLRRRNLHRRPRGRPADAVADQHRCARYRGAAHHHHAAPPGRRRADRGALHRGPDRQEGPVARPHRSAAVRAGPDAGPGHPGARRGPARGGASDLATLSHLAAAGFDRPAGGRHPGRAGQAARRHRDHRPRRRRRRPPQPRLHPHHRAGHRPHRPAHGRFRQHRGGQCHHRHRHHHADEPDRRAVLDAARPGAGGAGPARPERGAAGQGDGPDPRHGAGPGHLLDPRQRDRHHHRHRQGEGALRQCRHHAVPEPVRQRADDLAIDRRRGGAGDRGANRAERHLRLRHQRRPHGLDADRQARRFDGRGGGDPRRPAARRERGHRRRRPDPGRCPRRPPGRSAGDRAAPGCVRSARGPWPWRSRRRTPAAAAMTGRRGPVA